MNQHHLMIGALLTAYFGANLLVALRMRAFSTGRSPQRRVIETWHFHCGDCLLSWGLG
jgi:hypothetical protein